LTTTTNREAVSISPLQPAAAGNKPDTLSTDEEMDNSAAQNISQIRDILFGREMTRYEKRFNHIEARLIERTDQIKQEVFERLRTLETLIHTEIEAVTNQLKSEENGRVQQGMDLSGELKSTAATLTQAVNQLQDKLTQTTDSHRQQLLDQARSLNEKITSVQKETTASLNQSTEQLQADKVDRSALSGLLIHLAEQLSPPFSGGESGSEIISDSGATLGAETKRDHE